MTRNPYIPVKIVEIRNETANTKSFVLRQLEGKPIRYAAGQFLTLVFKKRKGEDRRSYSISSTPSLKEPLTITVKRIDNGEYSRYLFDHANAGDILVSIGASGYFTLGNDLTGNEQFIFLAAGSGITPILPLIKTLLHTTAKTRVSLIYSSHIIEETIFHEEIKQLATKFSSRLHVDFLFSSSQNLLKARLTKSLLIEYLKAKSVRKDKTLFYICGPFHYMQMATITLLGESVPPENIRKENFSTEKPVVKELPPDVNPHNVTLHVDENRYELTVQYPLTILEAAKQNGIVLPYSCEAGKCGTCSATCLQGQVWHSYNEVLVDRELRRGRILTCTGYPYGTDDVIVTFNETNGT